MLAVVRGLVKRCLMISEYKFEVGSVRSLQKIFICNVQVVMIIFNEIPSNLVDFGNLLTFPDGV